MDIGGANAKRFVPSGVEITFAKKTGERRLAAR
jgi:hypothetical protein